jgi:hypothetical protein
VLPKKKKNHFIGNYQVWGALCQGLGTEAEISISLSLYYLPTYLSSLYLSTYLSSTYYLSTYQPSIYLSSIFFFTEDRDRLSLSSYH